jgi:hypothetical protein
VPRRMGEVLIGGQQGQAIPDAKLHDQGVDGA